MPKPSLSRRERPQHFDPHRLVAGLHVGQHRVVEHVGQEREEQVPEIVREQEHAMPSEKPRSVDDVGTPLADQLDQLRELFRRVLRVGVLNDDQVAGDLLEPEPQRRPLAAVRLVKELERIFLRQLAQDVGRAVLRAVVDDDQLDAEAGNRKHARDHALDRVALVVDGHDDRQQRILEDPLYALPSSSDGVVGEPLSLHLLRAVDVPPVEDHRRLHQLAHALEVGLAELVPLGGNHERVGPLQGAIALIGQSDFLAEDPPRRPARACGS